MAEEPVTQTRAIRIPIGCPDDKYKAVLGGISRVRASAREMYARLYMAQAAGSSVSQNDEGDVKVVPDNKRARMILAAAYEKREVHANVPIPGTGRKYAGKVSPELATGVEVVPQSKTPAYEMRALFLAENPTLRSFVWDGVRKLVWSRWTAADPGVAKATGKKVSRGWLELQGGRPFQNFRGVGIEFPRLVLKDGAVAEHAVTLEWDREAGPVTFKVGTLDPGLWHRWKRVAAGEVKHGTLSLNERDGKLMLYVPYEESVTADATLDYARGATVSVTADAAQMDIVGPDAAQHADALDLTEARDWLLRLAVQQGHWQRRRGATGNPRKPWGEPRRFRAIARHGRRVTECRTNGSKGRNHAWAVRVVSRAVGWRCGTVHLTIPEGTTLGGQPWQWRHFADVLRYKLEAVGVRMVYDSSVAK